MKVKIHEVIQEWHGMSVKRKTITQFLMQLGHRAFFLYAVGSAAALLCNMEPQRAFSRPAFFDMGSSGWVFIRDISPMRIGAQQRTIVEPFWEGTYALGATQEELNKTYKEKICPSFYAMVTEAINSMSDSLAGRIHRLSQESLFQGINLSDFTLRFPLNSSQNDPTDYRTTLIHSQNASNTVSAPHDSLREISWNVYVPRHRLDHTLFFPADDYDMWRRLLYGMARPLGSFYYEKACKWHSIVCTGALSAWHCAVGITFARYLLTSQSPLLLKYQCLATAGIGVLVLLHSIRSIRLSREYAVERTALNWMPFETLGGIPFFYTEEMLHQALAEEQNLRSSSKMERTKEYMYPLVRWMIGHPSAENRLVYMMRHLNLSGSGNSSQHEWWSATQRAVDNFLLQHNAASDDTRMNPLLLQKVADRVQKRLKLIRCSHTF